MDEQTIDHDSQADATVNASAQTTLYDDQGRPFTVPAADTDVWISRGFRRQPRDAAGSLQSLPALWNATYAALATAVSESVAADCLDAAAGAAYHTARVALLEFEQQIVAVLDGLHALPVKQGE